MNEAVPSTQFLHEPYSGKKERYKIVSLVYQVLSQKTGRKEFSPHSMAVVH